MSSRVLNIRLSVNALTEASPIRRWTTKWIPHENGGGRKLRGRWRNIFCACFLGAVGLPAPPAAVSAEEKGRTEGMRLAAQRIRVEVPLTATDFDQYNARVERVEVETTGASWPLQWEPVVSWRCLSGRQAVRALFLIWPLKIRLRWAEVTPKHHLTGVDEASKIQVPPPRHCVADPAIGKNRRVGAFKSDLGGTNLWEPFGGPRRICPTENPFWSTIPVNPYRAGAMEFQCQWPRTFNLSRKSLLGDALSPTLRAQTGLRSSPKGCL